MRSIVALNKVHHFQTIASATRLLFELHLDIRFLSNDPTCEAAKQYFEFVEIERYRSAEQAVTFSTKNPNVLQDIAPQMAFFGDLERKKRIEASVGRNRKGKMNYPIHWTRMDVRARAKVLGLEAWYVETYPVLSWYVHAGAAGIGGMSRESLEGFFGVCHRRVQAIFLEATATCARETRIDAIECFGSWLEDLRLKTIRLIDEAGRDSE